MWDAKLAFPKYKSPFNKCHAFHFSPNCILILCPKKSEEEEANGSRDVLNFILAIFYEVPRRGDKQANKNVCSFVRHGDICKHNEVIAPCGFFELLSVISYLVTRPVGKHERTFKSQTPGQTTIAKFRFQAQEVHGFSC